MRARIIRNALALPIAAATAFALVGVTASPAQAASPATGGGAGTTAAAARTAALADLVWYCQTIGYSTGRADDGYEVTERGPADYTAIAFGNCY